LLIQTAGARVGEKGAVEAIVKLSTWSLLVSLPADLCASYIWNSSECFIYYRY